MFRRVAQGAVAAALLLLLVVFMPRGASGRRLLAAVLLALLIGLFMPGLVGRSFAGQQHPPVRPSPSGGVEFLPPAAPGLLQRSGLYRLWNHLYWSDAAVEEGMRSVSVVLRDIAALAKARRAPCIFLVTGRTPQWMLHDLFEVPALDYVVAEVPEEALLADGHPALQGSIRIADALEQRLRTTIATR